MLTTNVCACGSIASSLILLSTVKLPFSTNTIRVFFQSHNIAHLNETISIWITGRVIRDDFRGLGATDWSFINFIVSLNKPMLVWWWEKYVRTHRWKVWKDQLFTFVIKHRTIYVDKGYGNGVRYLGMLEPAEYVWDIRAIGLQT